LIRDSFNAALERFVKLHEYQTKQIFSRYQIPIPRGEVASTPEGVRAIAERIGGSIIVKSQVLVGRSRKAGGVKIAATPVEAEAVARRMLGTYLRGRLVQKVLVEEAVELKEEVYLAITIDRTARKPLLIAATEDIISLNGMARHNSNIVARHYIDPLLGLLDFEARNMAYDIGLRHDAIAAFVTVAKGLYRAFAESDAQLVELNPLMITPDGQLIAVGAKMDLDNDALFRHARLAEQRDVDEESEIEREAFQAGLSYQKLNGNIGCMVNGAGLAMATMDLIHYFGGQAANFLDLGDLATAAQVRAALHINLIDPQVKVVLCNIFGNTTRCDEVARGILAALDLTTTTLPIVIRLTGVNEQEGKALLAAEGLTCIHSMSEAAQKAVALAKGAMN
jgi:succinyl-CoA synthetase beta subunit